MRFGAGQLEGLRLLLRPVLDVAVHVGVASDGIVNIDGKVCIALSDCDIFCFQCLSGHGNRFGLNRKGGHEEQGGQQQRDGVEHAFSP